jgi:hypothetical protein
VASGDGAKFPAAPFNATVWPANAQPTTANAEIVRVTAVVTDTLTITRAQESTSARTVVVGDQIAATITKKTLTDIETAIPSPSTAATLRDTSGAPVLITGDQAGDYALEASAQTIYGPLTALGTFVNGDSWNTASVASAAVIPIAPNAMQTYDLISGWLAESLPRSLALIDQVTMVSGTLIMSRVYLRKGTPIGHLNYSTGSVGAASPTHSWLALYDSNRVQLATTSDLGSGAISTFTTPTTAYPIAQIASGSASTFTTTYSGWHYIGFCVVSGTPKLYGLPSNPPMNQAPGLGGTSDTGQTGPPSFPHTAGAITFIGSPMAYLGASN